MNSKRLISTNNKADSQKEDATMMENMALKAANEQFNEFLRLNRSKIAKITPKNPTISKNDEWYRETFWDTDYKEKNKE